MTRSLTFACLAVSLLCGCNRASPTGPSAPPSTGPRTGTWVGTLSDSVNGSGTVRIVLGDTVVDSQRSLLSGTWSTTYADASKNGTGAASGTVAGTSGTLMLSPATALVCPPGTPFGAAAGAYVAVDLVVTSSTITGAYVLGSCTGAATGSVDLRKQ